MNVYMSYLIYCNFCYIKGYVWHFCRNCDGHLVTFIGQEEMCGYHFHPKQR